jgi:hypothetical protein
LWQTRNSFGARRHVSGGAIVTVLPAVVVNLVEPTMVN